MEKQTKSLDWGRHFDFQGGGELPNTGHFVPTTYLGKVKGVFPLTPCGLEMAFKRSVCGEIPIPPPLPNYHMRVK